MRRLNKRFLLLTVVFIAAVTAASIGAANEQKALATVPGTNTLVSANSSYTSPVLGGETLLSADGKFAAFNSPTNSIVSGDFDSSGDVFIRNLASQTTSIVSVSSSGVQSDNWSTTRAISETGRYVVFSSNATNLIDGTTISSAIQQIYLRDTVANTTKLISKNSSGTPGDEYSMAFDVSSDGRFVLLGTPSTNLNSSVTNAGFNYYMYDGDSSTFTPLNYKYDSTLPAINGNSGLAARMSCDGALVVFIATGLTNDAAASNANVFLLDRRAGDKITNVTLPANAPGITSPSISCNGNYIGFASYANNLDPGTGTSAPQYRHAYAYDRINDTFTMVDKSATGVAGNNNLTCDIYTVSCVQISNYGIATFISSWTTNLTSPAASGPQIYVKDLATGAIELLSRDSSGTAGNNDSHSPSISSDGSKIGYSSHANNLLPLIDTDYNIDGYVSLTGY